MLGPMISDKDIVKAPRWFRILFHIAGAIYLFFGIVITIAFIPVAAIRELFRYLRKL